MPLPRYLVQHRDPNPAQRVRTLESLRASVRDNKGQLLIGNLKKLFQTLTLCLADSDYHITLQALGLLADIAPDSQHDVGNFIPFLMVLSFAALRLLWLHLFTVHFYLTAAAHGYSESRS